MENENITTLNKRLNLKNLDEKFIFLEGLMINKNYSIGKINKNKRIPYMRFIKEGDNIVIGLSLHYIRFKLKELLKNGR